MREESTKNRSPPIPTPELLVSSFSDPLCYNSTAPFGLNFAMFSTEPPVLALI